MKFKCLKEKNVNNILVLVLATVVLSCASSKNGNDKLPLETGDVYYQEKTEYNTKTALGMTIFIPVISNPHNFKLDRIYFQGQETRLKLTGLVYVGIFEHLYDHKPDIIMSSPLC